MSNNDRIEAALSDLESQEIPNYSTTTKKHGVVRTTLMRRFTGKTVSNYEANTEYQQALNIAQEKVLLIMPSTTEGGCPTAQSIQWLKVSKIPIFQITQQHYFDNLAKAGRAFK